MGFMEIMNSRDEKWIEAFIEGKWVKYDLDDEGSKERDGFEYLGNDFACRAVWTSGYDYKTDEPCLRYQPQRDNTGHIYKSIRR